jgi:hypothetical protein
MLNVDCGRIATIITNPSEKTKPFSKTSFHKNFVLFTLPLGVFQTRKAQKITLETTIRVNRSSL